MTLAQTVTNQQIIEICCDYIKINIYILCDSQDTCNKFDEQVAEKCVKMDSYW